MYRPGIVFFLDHGTIKSPFPPTTITTLVNVFTTLLAFGAIERFGRRRLFLIGASCRVVCEPFVAIVGTIDSRSQSAISPTNAFICRWPWIKYSPKQDMMLTLRKGIYIFFFATNLGHSMVKMESLTGEIFSIPIRTRGMGLSTTSNRFWNSIIATITLYMVGAKYWNPGLKIFSSRVVSPPAR